MGHASPALLLPASVIGAFHCAGDAACPGAAKTGSSGAASPGHSSSCGSGARGRSGAARGLQTCPWLGNSWKGSWARLTLSHQGTGSSSSPTGFPSGPRRGTSPPAAQVPPQGQHNESVLLLAQHPRLSRGVGYIPVLSLVAHGLGKCHHAAFSRAQQSPGCVGRCAMGSPAPAEPPLLPPAPCRSSPRTCRTPWPRPTTPPRRPSPP